MNIYRALFAKVNMASERRSQTRAKIWPFSSIEETCVFVGWIISRDSVASPTVMIYLYVFIALLRTNWQTMASPALLLLKRPKKAFLIQLRICHQYIWDRLPCREYLFSHRRSCEQKRDIFRTLSRRRLFTSSYKPRFFHSCNISTMRVLFVVL